MDEVENEYIRYWTIDGILMSEYKRETAVTLEKCKEIIDLRHQISKKQMQYWLYDMSRITEMPKDARDYADKYGQDYLHACAAVVDSSIAKFLYNVFANTKTPKIPLRAFTDTEKALTWLREIKNTKTADDAACH
ncbi:MAG: hypothetical protein ACKOXB_02155 [Flavobacteriales bacterium]